MKTNKSRWSLFKRADHSIQNDSRVKKQIAS